MVNVADGYPQATTGPPGPPKGPPYPPNTWTSGGKPELKVDVPITAVFIVLFIFGAIAHVCTNVIHP